MLIRTAASSIIKFIVFASEELLACSTLRVTPGDGILICVFTISFIDPSIFHPACRFFDTSKQGVGAAIIHFANVIISSQTAAGDQKTDPCIW